VCLGWLGGARHAVRRLPGRVVLRAALTFGGLASFDVAAWQWCAIAGWVVLGVVLLAAEWAIKDGA